jgi:hypothetical protein
MTVGDLIDELRRYPMHKPVRVVISEFHMVGADGDWVANVGDDDAQDVDAAVNMGSHVLIRGRS